MTVSRIVLLDDEVNLLRTFARILEREGHEVVIGRSFAEVEATLQPGRFDLLITDIVMSEVDGLEVLREVVERRGCREPVVLLTGLPNLDTAAEAVRRGAFDYVGKPVTKDRLLEVVARGLKHVQLLRERDHAQQKEMDMMRNLACLGEQASFLSHEIRTPVTSLRQALHAVADRLQIDDKVVIEDLIRNLQRIERLLAETLSFAKPLDLRLGRVSVAALVADALGQARQLPAFAAMRVEQSGLAEAGELVADGQLLGQVLVNLFRNAAEACQGKGRIEIRVRTEGRDTIVLDVADDGPGVPIGRRDEIFRPFHSSKDGGTGIGLAFSRKVLTAHRGSLELAARQEQGACFRLRLPRSPDRETACETRP